MPGHDDTREFDRIVARLRADDPQFANRVDRGPADEPTEPLTPPGPVAPFGASRLSQPRRRLVAWLCAIVALFSVVLGGWTGLIIAIAIAVWAVRMVLARPDRM